LAAQEISKGAGSQFDPTVVAAFLKLFKDGKLDDLIESTQQQSALTTTS